MSSSASHGDPAGALPRRGRPPSAAKRSAILAAATESFLTHGYTRTTLDDVAAAAGVSKQTVYSHFTDKETLFLAVLTAVREAGPGPGPSLGSPWLSEHDLRGSLTRCGERLLAASMNEQVA